METVVANFLTGLQRKGIRFHFNRPTFAISRTAPVISFGLGLDGVRGLRRSNPVIAAVGFPYPGELPELCSQYNVKRFLQHSAWVLDFVRSARVYPDDVFDLWPAGIDTDRWSDVAGRGKKDLDVLLYRKVLWNKEAADEALLEPIRQHVSSRGLSFAEVVYGHYDQDEYRNMLARSKVMVFVCEHESQGLAYQEALSSGVPVVAWDQGQFLDPVRLSFGRPFVPASSVPFFDERCGKKFRNAGDFGATFDAFYEEASLGKYRPREFIIESLTIEKSTDRMLEICGAL